MSDSRDPSTGPPSHSSRAKSSSKRPKQSSKSHPSAHGREKTQGNSYPKRKWNGQHHPKPEWRENRPSFQRQDSSTSQGKRESVTVETSSLRPQLRDGKKKVSLSLNHLLNFTLPPRESGSWEGHSRPKSHRTYQHFNKEHFLQANCQFVVKGTGDYSVHLHDPDTLVEWDCIEQVRLFCDEMPCCPICLYPPVAAKITKCGHVFCWSCILHYLTLSDHKWQKCPICYVSIYRADLKSVVAVSSKVYSVGDTITMSLMMRPKNGTTVLPKSQWSEEHGHQLLSMDAVEVTNFVKLLSATPKLVLETIISKEKHTLERQLASLSEDEESEKCFVEAALADLEEREAELIRLNDCAEDLDELVQVLGSKFTDYDKKSSVSTTDDESSSTWNTITESSFDAPFSDTESDSDKLNDDNDDSGGGGGDGDNNDGDGVELAEVTREKMTTSPGKALETEDPLRVEIIAGQQEPNQPTDCSQQVDDKQQEDHSPKDTGGISPPKEKSPSTSEYVYFFQSADGQHLYLHPINARCLMKEYESLEFAPESIKAKIVDVEQLGITEATRSRFRYLRHLPLTCQFALCELDLRPPLLSKATLREYEADLKKRRQKRFRKEKERQHSSAQNEVLDLKSKKPSQISPEEFHDLLSVASSPPLPTPSAVESPPVKITASVVKFEEGTLPQQQQTNMAHTVSFASALKCPSKSTLPPVWPGKAGKDLEAAPKPPPLPATRTVAVNSDGEEEVSNVPSFQDAFGISLSAAFENVHSSSVDKSGKPGGSKTAKKGKKKMVLFTTSNMRRGV